MVQNLVNVLKRFPLETRLIALIIAPLILISSFIYLKLKIDLPQQTFVLVNPANSRPVSIDRDDQGVPHISATSDHDAFFAVGYVHAQDRLWQLEMQRRLVQGRLSEVLGKDAVQQDIWFRTLGLYESAKAAWPTLSKEAQASLSAYAEGINAEMASNNSLPLEFKILNFSPKPWTEIDSLALIKMFAFDLGGNFRKEIQRYIVNQSIPAERIETFFPNYPATSPTTIASTNIQNAKLLGLENLLTFQNKLEQMYGLGGNAVGSNAWVVSGKHTSNGASLLANDPHLGLQIPSVWYAISIKGEKLNVSGMNLVGLPLIIFGHNQDIAWGGTSMMADTQDLYLEHEDAIDSHYYQIDGANVPFEIRKEEIDIRPDFPEQLHKKYLPIQLKIRSTKHGPVVSDQFRVFDFPVSLRWTALDSSDTSYEAFYRLGYSTDWDSFKQSMSMLIAPALNMLFADKKGNIGFLGAGRIPIRGTGDGSVPSPGWVSGSEWTGYVPPKQMPQVFNPKSGYIVNANNKVIGSDYPYFISKDWASPARAKRIEQMLTKKIDSGERLGIEDMQKIQGDTVDLEAQNLLLALNKFIPQTSEQSEAWNYLKKWDGDMAFDSVAASIFHVWMRNFREQLFEPYLKDRWRNNDQFLYESKLSGSVQLSVLAGLLIEKNSPWCSANGNTTQKTCQEVLASSLELAIKELQKTTSDSDMTKWKWGKLQTVVYRHTPFSDLRPFNKFFEMRISSGGSNNSINVAATEYSGKEGYQVHFGPSFRQVISISKENILEEYMNSTGQSGNLMSAHYSDMVEAFRDKHYFLLDSDKVTDQSKLKHANDLGSNAPFKSKEVN